MSSEDPFQIAMLGPALIPNPMGPAAHVKYIDDEQRMLVDPHLGPVLEATREGRLPPSFEIAGPRRQIYFDPTDVRVAIVTCGGLCPGINAVIRGLVLQLWYMYGCQNIVGIRFGYQGLARGAEGPVVLDPTFVTDIRGDGGTVLGSSRGTPPTSEIVDSLVRHEIDILFTVGGDGTMRGAGALWEQIRARKLAISVVGVPKTIDNDIPFVYGSFGFATAVEEATNAVNRAEVEARGVPYGIGLVKLMGRDAGYIAVHAALASGNANFCLIPEVEFSLDGPGGLLNLVEKRLRARGHAVIVVAEGAGQAFFEDRKDASDASGNQKLSDIGQYLAQRLLAYFAPRKLPVTLKYIDPSYLIRAAPPIPEDQRYCDHLARSAVHAAMAGKGGLLVGQWHGCLTHVPIRALDGKRNRVNPDGETWFNVRENTGQPHVIG